MEKMDIIIRSYKKAKEKRILDGKKSGIELRL